MPTDLEDGMWFAGGAPEQLFIVGEDGAKVPFNGIGTAEIADTHAYNGITVEDLCKPMEFSFSLRMRKGMTDILLGRYWTKRAQRAIRWNKRHKEKLRRQKLKEGTGHGHADMGGTGS